MEFGKEQIVYVDIIGKNITIKLKDLYNTGIEYIILSFDSPATSHMYLLQLKDKYDLINNGDRINQYFVKK